MSTVEVIISETGCISAPHAPWSETLDAVGNTPLVRLQRIMATRATVLAKLEFLNPAGSSKDRIAVAMIDRAEAERLLAPGGTIVEPTSGNTGIALAMVAAIRGYRCILVVPEKTSAEKVATMRAYGAKVVVAPNVPPDSPRAYTALAARIANSLAGAYMPDQYSNDANPAAHEKTTGPEIWHQTAGRVTHVVAGIGTGGTLCGVSRALKARKPSVQVIGVDPTGSIYSGAKPAAFAVEGIGRHYLPPTLDLGVIDALERVDDHEAFAMARRVAREEGLLVGGSAGATLVAAQRIARDLDDHAVMVVVLADSGRAYLSKIWNDGWLEERNLAAPWSLTLADIFHAAYPQPTFVDADWPLARAEQLLLTCTSDLAVVDQGRHVGRITAQNLIDALRSNPSARTRATRYAMGAPFPVLDESAFVEEAYAQLRLGETSIVVTRAERAIATLGARDLLKFAAGDA